MHFVFEESQRIKLAAQLVSFEINKNRPFEKGWRLFSFLIPIFNLIPKPICWHQVLTGIFLRKKESLQKSKCHF